MKNQKTTLFMILMVLLLISHSDAFASHNLREAANDLKGEVESIGPLVAPVGVGVGGILMMLGLGGIGRFIAGTGVTGFLVFTIWPTIQSLLQNLFHR